MRAAWIAGMVCLGCTATVTPPVMNNDAGAPAPDVMTGPTEPASDPAAPFALMELFTSEGCNSCPPADDAMNKIALAEQSNPRRVMVLAWHVDYWDYLGWKDPYASKYATDRQKLYAKAWSSTQIYTPALAVGGKEHRGWTPTALEGKITTNLAVPVDVSTTVWTADPDASPLTVEVRVENAPDDAKTMVVLVERGLAQKPNAGENKGVQLHHENTARAWATTTTGRSTVELTVPDGVVRTNASIIAFVQRADMSPPLGATRVDLHP